MYAHLRDRCGYRTIAYPRELLIADRARKWNVAPFHYVPEVYRHTVSELSRLTA